MTSAPQSATLKQIGAAEPTSFARAVFTLVVLSLIGGLNNVDRNMFGLILPQIKADIHLSDFVLGFLSGPAFVIIYSTAGVPLAWLADKTSRRNIIAFGLGFWSLVTMATGLATNVVHLLFSRAFLGVGEASNMAPSSAMIGDLFPKKTRAVAVAVFAAGGPLGVMMAFPLIGWMTEHHGWRTAFYVMGAFGVSLAVFALVFLREPPREATAEQTTDGNSLSFRSAVATAARSKPFLLLIVGATMLSINYSAMIVWVPTFMARVHDLNAQETGAYLGLYRGLFGVIAALCGGLIVTLLSRLDGRALAWVPAGFYVVMCPAELLLLFSDGSVGWQIGLALDNLFMNATIPCTFALLLALVDPKMRAVGSSFYLLIFNLVGQIVGPLAVGGLNEVLQPVFGETAIRYSLLISPISMVIGAAILLMLAKYFKEDRQGGQSPSSIQ